MAIKYLSNISLEGNELQNVKIHSLGTAPTALAGGLYYNTSTEKLMASDGTNWYSVNGSLESLSSGNGDRITIGGTAAAPTVDVVTGAIADGGNGLATADQIHTFVTGLVNAVPTETVTSLGLAANVLTYTDENGSDTDIDLSLYLDDSNLARLTSGAIDGATGIATFTRDDATTFTIDMSAFLDGITVNNTLTSTSTTEGLSAAQGKALKDLIDALPDNDTQLTDSEIGAMGYIKDYTPTEAEVTAHEAALTIGYGQLTGTPTIPTNNNQLTNGENYITGVDFDEIGGSQSDLDLSGFNNDLTLAPSDAEKNVQADYNATSGDAFILNKPTLFDGAYSSLSGQPTIPSNNNQLTNGEGYISDYTVTSGDVTAHEGDITITESQISDLSHFSGSYDDLTDVPSNLGAQQLSIAGNTITLDNGGNSIDIYDQTLNKADSVEFNDIFADRVLLDPTGVGAPYVGSVTTAWDAASGNAASPITSRFNKTTVAATVANDTSNVSGEINIVEGNGTVDHGYIYAAQDLARTTSSGDYEGQVGLYAAGSHRGSGSTDGIVNGLTSIGEVNATGTGSVNYVRGIDVGGYALGSADVNYLQGMHLAVDVGNATIKEDLTVGYFDFDYSGTGKVEGDFSYIRAGLDTNSMVVDGDARFIWQENALPSLFGGTVEANQLIKTGGTSSQFLKADGSVDSSTYITSASLPTSNSELTNGEGYISDYTVTSADVTAHEGDITITESQISDLSHFSGDYNDLSNLPSLQNVGAASTTAAGIVELATNTEAKAGTMTNRAVTPQGAIQLVDQQIAADKVNVTIGNGTDTTLTATHNFGNKKCLVSVTEVATGDEVFAEIVKGTNAVSVIFGSAPASNAYEVSMFKMS